MHMISAPDDAGVIGGGVGITEFPDVTDCTATSSAVVASTPRNTRTAAACPLPEAPDAVVTTDVSGLAPIRLYATRRFVSLPSLEYKSASVV